MSWCFTVLWLNYSQQLQVLKSIYSQLCFRNCRDQGLNEMNWPAQTKPPPKNNYLLYLLCIDSEDWRMIQSISNKQQKQWYWKKIFRISWLFCCITSWNEYWLLYTHCNFCAAEFILWVFLSLRCGTECSGNANIACIEHLQGEDYHHPPLPYLKYNNICQLSFYAFNSTKTVLFYFLLIEQKLNSFGLESGFNLPDLIRHWDLSSVSSSMHDLNGPLDSYKILWQASAYCNTINLNISI